ncbi:MAG: cbb3-type cytochrome c oxidase subunit I [Flavobacteriales bacterium]|nr:cbb3-type cytochrome c oxidase subunit I [Flavobacteriales bacterium]
MNKDTGINFLIVGIGALVAGMFYGCFGALQHVYPELNEYFSFQKTRPLHVSLVISWLYLGAIGGIYYYLPNKCGVPLYSTFLAKLHLWIFTITGFVIIGAYFMGIFGGREYWAFPPILAIPIVLSWIMFGYNYFRTIFTVKTPWPVYYWMWGTGILFFLFTFLESYLWMIPYFGDSIVRDMTVQWKSYGAIVGSWNMLIYGTAIFLMEKVSEKSGITELEDDAPTVGHSKIAFLLFFLGFLNLLFGWAHHLYLLPSAGWIRHMGYLISMTELLIIAKLIWQFRASFIAGKKRFHIMPFRFLMAADIWIFINLALALLISVPAIQLYTHGTHITVAHAMGSTIGINTMILLASLFYVVGERKKVPNKGVVASGFWIANISFFIFFVCLTIAGIMKGFGVIEKQQTFHEVKETISPFIRLFAYSGLVMFVGFCMILIPAAKTLMSSVEPELAEESAVELEPAQ